MTRRRPNILLLVADQHRADWLGCHGAVPVRTPNLDRLAGRGVRFRNAWTPSPVCSPARACMALGVDYDASPVRNNKQSLPLTADTFYRRLSRGGYDVRNVGKLDLLKPDMSWGADGQHRIGGVSRFRELGFTGGRDSAGKHDGVAAYRQGRREPYFLALERAGLAEIHAADYEKRSPGITGLSPRASFETRSAAPASYANAKPSPLPEGLYCDDWVAVSALAELEQLCVAEAPWLLTVNFSGPHEPLDVTPRMRDLVGERDFGLPRPCAGVDAGQHARMRRDYAAIVERIDGWCGQLVEALGRYGRTDDTLVIYTSDHGEMLGDRYLWGKGVPYDPSVRIPMILAGPGVVDGGRIEAGVVSLIDVTATILDVAGAAGESVPGARSLRPILEASARRVRSHVLSGLGTWRAAFDGRFKLVAGFDIDLPHQASILGIFDEGMIADAALYDLLEDPEETVNVATAHAARAESLRQALLRR